MSRLGKLDQSLALLQVVVVGFMVWIFVWVGSVPLDEDKLALLMLGLVAGLIGLRANQEMRRSG